MNDRRRVQHPFQQRDQLPRTGAIGVERRDRRSVSDRPRARGCWTSGSQQVTSSSGSGPPGSGESTAGMTAGFSTSASSVDPEATHELRGDARQRSARPDRRGRCVISSLSGRSRIGDAASAAWPYAASAASRRPSERDVLRCRRAASVRPDAPAACRRVPTRAPAPCWPPIRFSIPPASRSRRAHRRRRARSGRPPSACAPSRQPSTMLQSPPSTSANRPMRRRGRHARPPATRE